MPVKPSTGETSSARLFDLSRDVLLTTDRADTLEVLARQIARRFELARLAVCLPGSDGRWEVHKGGEAPLALEESTLIWR